MLSSDLPSDLLAGAEISEQIKKSSANAKDIAYIASAFCKSDAFRNYLEAAKGNTPKKIIIVRWQLRDLLSGASDLALYTSTQKYGWLLYINQGLHAKAFLFDRVAIIGSANLTNRGFAGSPPAGNHELATLSMTDDKLRNWFDTIISESRLMDDELFQCITEELNNVEPEPMQSILNKKSFSPNTMRLIAQREEFQLYTHDLFWTDSPDILLNLQGQSDGDVNALHDIEMLRLDSEIELETLKIAFQKSPGMEWLKSTVKDEIYFGELTKKLHDTLNDDPAPFRKKVKDLLQNLLSWVDRVGSDQFIVDRPNHSQRIRRVQQ